MSTLPKLNSDYTYEMTLPVTGTKHKYRPYLVKEEKALLMANEAGDRSAIAIAMRDTLESCVQGLEVDLLPLADMEYAFTLVRARSAGEVVPMKVKCEQCETPHRINVNLLDASVTATEYTEKHSIELAANWILELRWPTLSTAINSSDIENKIDMAFAMLSESLHTLKTPDGIWDFNEVSKEEKTEFIDSMNSEQLNKVKDYLESMPQCKIDIEYVCSNCGAENKTEVLGLENFFG